MGAHEWDPVTEQMVPIQVPDWYLPIRAAKYGGVPVTTALGCDWSPIVEEWCLIAEAAEHEAEAAMVKEAQKKAKAERG